MIDAFPTLLTLWTELYPPDLYFLKSQPAILSRIIVFGDKVFKEINIYIYSNLTGLDSLCEEEKIPGMNTHGRKAKGGHSKAPVCKPNPKPRD